jgi:glycosyltransferase involved in cell wall biosynthesis
MRDRKPKAKIKVLFVGMIDTVHVAYWISQIRDQNWEIYLFPVESALPTPGLRDLSLFATRFFRPAFLDKSVRYIRWSSLSFYLDTLNRMLLKHQHFHKFKEWALLHAIQSIQPDIIHSMEFQHAGYLTLSVKKKLGNKFPTWIATSWGSDLYLFGRFPEHQGPIRQVLESCNYYSGDCVRDVQLARNMGFKGLILPVFPGRGGFDIKYMTSFRQSGPVSTRKTILVKGYQGWAGRALVAFQAFRHCLDILRDYTIVLYAVVEDVKIAARLFEQETGLPIKVVPASSPESEILSQFGKARVHIGLSISDGTPNSLLEAMVMGAFPIQSCTSCADEWIQDGKGGLIVPPEEPSKIANAIRRALTDDALVDQAAEINAQTARERLDYSVIQPQVMKIYRDICESLRNNA